MKEKWIIAIIIAAIIAIAAAYSVENGVLENKSKKINASLIINFGNESWNFNITLNNSATVYSLLMKGAEENNFTVSTTYYPQYQSYFINSIAGVKNGNGKYWQYWINGKYGEVSANLQKLENGDVVEWKFI